MAKAHKNSMVNKDSFSGYHPVVNFLYFTLVIVFAMFFMNPVSLGISLISALIYGIYLNGRKTALFSAIFLLPMMLITALINPVFSHEGNTILTYLPSGNPLTLESILYGIAAATMLAAVITWFNCYSAVITSDKFVYLFGRIIPALSLILSMTLRFIPKFKEQMLLVTDTQRTLGRDISEGSMLQRIKIGITILSIMITWALENAIETADSMKSRGYGLKGRTAFSIYNFDKRDKQIFLWLVAVALYMVLLWKIGVYDYRYFPTFDIPNWSILTISGQLIYLMLCLTPVALNVMEDRKWKRLQSKI